jgi:hypothetical protein
MPGDKKILFVIPSLAGGGAERAFVLLLQYLDRSKFAPSLILLEEKNEYRSDIPSDVAIRVLGKRIRYDFFEIIELRINNGTISYFLL